MSYQLSYAQLTTYDVGQSSITIPLILSLSQDLEVNCQAKVDTESSFCLFARELGEPWPR